MSKFSEFSNFLFAAHFVPAYFSLHLKNLLVDMVKRPAIIATEMSGTYVKN
jgi:hypothetical protein